MFKIEELDKQVTAREQLDDESDGPVVLMNIFHVAPEQADGFIETWGGIIRRFKTAPGGASRDAGRMGRE